MCVCQNDEVSLQRKVRTEVIQLEDTLAQVRKEYEMLRIEFEQTLAANEQAGDSHIHVSLLGVTFICHVVPKKDRFFLGFSLSLPKRPNKSRDASPYQHVADA